MELPKCVDSVHITGSMDVFSVFKMLNFISKMWQCRKQMRWKQYDINWMLWLRSKSMIVYCIHRPILKAHIIIWALRPLTSKNKEGVDGNLIRCSRKLEKRLLWYGIEISLCRHNCLFWTKLALVLSREGPKNTCTLQKSIRHQIGMHIKLPQFWELITFAVNRHFMAFCCIETESAVK